MPKIRLDLDSLRVESFSTGPMPNGTDLTVFAQTTDIPDCSSAGAPCTQVASCWGSCQCGPGTDGNTACGCYFSWGTTYTCDNTCGTCTIGYDTCWSCEGGPTCNDATCLPPALTLCGQAC
jgi:hypothetical protein